MIDGYNWYHNSDCQLHVFHEDEKVSGFAELLRTNSLTSVVSDGVLTNIDQNQLGEIAYNAFEGKSSSLQNRTRYMGPSRIEV